jgi:hypothetical protein
MRKKSIKPTTATTTGIAAATSPLISPTMMGGNSGTLRTAGDGVDVSKGRRSRSDDDDYVANEEDDAVTDDGIDDDGGGSCVDDADDGARIGDVESEGGFSPRKLIPRRGSASDLSSASPTTAFATTTRRKDSARSGAVVTSSGGSNKLRGDAAVIGQRFLRRMSKQRRGNSITQALLVNAINDIFASPGGTYLICDTRYLG